MFCIPNSKNEPTSRNLMFFIKKNQKNISIKTLKFFNPMALSLLRRK